jgi:benzoyl-CoA reductase/2-hydroxyglutaryl-CoA dehydratase subunit BcrC/BadD/HgdB
LKGKLVAAELFKEAFNNRHEIAKEWKSAGRKVVGHFCSLVPEELFYAAGILPVGLLPDPNNRHLGQAEARLPSFVCHFAKGLLEVLGSEELDYLDGIVSPFTCDATRALFGIVQQEKANKGFFAFIHSQTIRNKGAYEHNIKEFYRLIQNIEDYFETTISKEQIHEAIQIYNQNRFLMRQLLEKGVVGGNLSGSDFFEVIRAGVVMPKDRHNEMVRVLLRHLEGGRKILPNKPIVVSGSTLESSSLFKIIEKFGMPAIPDLCFGLRYFLDDVPGDRDGVEALVLHSVNRSPCPCQVRVAERWDKLVPIIQKYCASGVILISQQYCDPCLFEAPYVKMTLEKHGIPCLDIEVEETASIEPNVEARIDFFLKALQLGGS